jgi:CRISPR-associated protein Cas2
MYLILAYDVESARTQVFNKICQRYLSRVQNSVFEGKLTDAQLRELKYEINQEIGNDEMVRIWEIADNQIYRVHTIGCVKIEESNFI